MRKTYNVNTNQKKSEIVTLISEKTDFRAKGDYNEYDRYYIMINGLNTPEDITILNICASHNNIVSHEEQTDIIEKINKQINYYKIIMKSSRTLCQ